jgi:hypothetical protein
MDSDGAVRQLPKPPGKTFLTEELKTQSQTNVYFPQQFFNKVLSDTDKMFPSFDRRTVDHRPINEILGPGATLVNGRLEVSSSVNHSWHFGVSLDFSGMGRAGDTLFLMGRHRNGTWTVIEPNYGNFTADKRIQMIDDMEDRGFRIAFVRAETNAVQSQIVEELKVQASKPAGRRQRFWASRIQSHHTGGNKNDPSTGVAPIDLEIQNRNFIFPDYHCQRNTGYHRENFIRLRDEMTNCPRFPKANQTPDGVMSLWFGYRGFRDFFANHTGTSTIKSIPIGDE